MDFEVDNKINELPMSMWMRYCCKQIHNKINVCYFLQVVCNWNESTPALLRQLALARRARIDNPVGDPIVVLADRAKRGMDQEVIQKVCSICISLSIGIFNTTQCLCVYSNASLCLAIHVWFCA